jgi:hypothetical protein
MRPVHAALILSHVHSLLYMFCVVGQALHAFGFLHTTQRYDLLNYALRLIDNAACEPWPRACAMLALMPRNTYVHV